MEKIKHLLNISFPYLNNWRRRSIHIAVTLLLCTFFIFGLNAFNISAWISIPGWISFLGLHGFILIGLCVMLLSQVVLALVFKNRDFKAKHLLVWLATELLILSLAVALVYGQSDYTLINEWISTLKYTAMVIVLPYTFSLLLLSSIFAEKETIESPSPARIVDLLHFPDEKEETRLSIKSSHVLYVESSDNYVTIYYTDANMVKKEMVRNTLKRIENEFKDKGLMRCHRSFIINVQNIETIKKVNRSYQIKLKHIDTVIPVSKSFIPQVKELFGQQ